MLAYNPAYAGTLPEDKLLGAQAHEVLHLAFGHHVRRQGRDSSLWNRACDLSINHILLETGFSLPQGFAHDPACAGMSADDIYALLARMQEGPSNGMAEKQQQSSPTEAEDGAGAMAFRNGQAADTPQAASRGEKTAPDAPENDEAAPSPTVTDADTAQSAQNAQAGQADFQGEVRDHPVLDGLQNSRAQKAAEQEADVAMQQALQRARHMGSMPAGVTRLLQRERQPELDWHELLRRFIENCAHNDYSWTTPNRRYLHQGIYLPCRREDRLPHVVLAVDSSGSVDEESLAAFCAELSSILDAYDTTLSVLFHDTTVRAEHTFTRMDLPLSLTPQGGGGTDFRPVGEYVTRQHMTPSCLIWFTDMECTLFPHAPDCPVLWVCSTAAAQPPPFGEVVTLDTARA